MPHLPSSTSHLAATYRTWAQLQDFKANPSLALDGNSLDIAAVVAVAFHGCVPHLSSDPEVIDNINASVRVLMEHLDQGYSIYGVNTGFGGSADSRTHQTTSLQAALLQHTQAGILIASDKDPDHTPGIPGSHSMPSAWVRAAIAVRANTNARGHSAVTIPVLDGLLRLLAHRITPIVPLRGSVSASGDLMPLSYIAGAIEGSPDIYVRVGDGPSARIMTARDALLAANLPRCTMGPKEGLGLLNGTAVSTAVASLALHEAHLLAVTSQALTAMGVEALTGTVESFHPFIHAARPHPGQIESAANILSLLQGSYLAAGTHPTDPKPRTRAGLIQDRYAWRSAPQWLGPQLEDLTLADKQLQTELNSSSDNPLICTASAQIYTGANFQAASVTSGMEKTRLALQMIGRLIFAQATELIDPSYNNGLPTNLVFDDVSLSFTMKGVDTSLAAYMAELAWTAHPISAHVQAAEMHNQAVNSLALISARCTMQAIELVSLMSAAYLYVACQAVDLRALHMAVLKGITTRVAKVTREVFESSLNDHLVDRVVDAVTTAWPTTTRLPIAERCRQAVQAAVPMFVDATTTTTTPTAELRLVDVSGWQQRAISAVIDVYHTTAARFVEHPHTADLLGAGAKVLYTTVRQDLKVPFHRGFVEHPTAQCGELDGRPKKTIGSWISVIYEALRRGDVQGPVLATLRELG
ncbi:phenylalanine ammonia-lyase [Aspergillus sclerotioniger CBS 115572]|uniref:Phenylalanine ammonia-lyase n=1 Tax=Aspergillus sclerotioniger CBS 115572 TaxID=1450535 RepID=A0A317V0V5_9EURO|nr:phenylalanine ammonia-lyase [Aspergillus sclerotioniger CBS 115572]PWY67596.1 phenylalanine ammonia-lyase [Aspergillus sclerotioniger CBS 115572]